MRSIQVRKESRHGSGTPNAHPARNTAARGRGAAGNAAVLLAIGLLGLGAAVSALSSRPVAYSRPAPAVRLWQWEIDNAYVQAYSEARRTGTISAGIYPLFADPANSITPLDDNVYVVSVLCSPLDGRPMAPVKLVCVVRMVNGQWQVDRHAPHPSPVRTRSDWH